MKNDHRLFGVKRIWFAVIFYWCCIIPIQAQENTARLCADGIDNDGDGMIDCDDQDCVNLDNNGCLTCFNDGLSFADVVIEYAPRCPDHNEMTNASLALGVSDYTSVNSLSNFVSLGEGGVLRLGFENNLVINSGDGNPDLWIFEIGQAVEATRIELRPANDTTRMRLEMSGITDSDGDGYYDFGQVSGATSSLDIDSEFSLVWPKAALRFNAIKLQDVDDRNCAGITSGADIDAVCALSSIPLEVCGNAIDDDQDGLTDCDDPDLQDECCCLTTATLSLGEDIEVCEGDTILLEVDPDFMSYQWQDGSQSSMFIATTSGTYSLTVTDENDCPITDQILLSFNRPIRQIRYLEKCPNEVLEYYSYEFPLPGTYFDTLVTVGLGCDSILQFEISDRVPIDSFLGPDQVTCDNELIIRSKWPATTWPDGQIGSEYKVTQSGRYQAVATDSFGCAITDDIELLFQSDAPFYMPTAFSPNDDGINDELMPQFAFGDHSPYTLFVYDRWGDLVFQGDQIINAWDGTSKQKQCMPGVYVWMLRLDDRVCPGEDIYEGAILLLR